MSPTAQRYMEIRQTLDIDFGITQELGLLDGSSSSYEGPAVSSQHLHLMKNQNRKGKTVERANTVCTMKQMMSQNQANCEEILVGENVQLCLAIVRITRKNWNASAWKFLPSLSILCLQR